MATVIKAGLPTGIDIAFELADLAAPGAELALAHAEAARIIAAAQTKAEQIRTAAHREGRQSGVEAARQQAESQAAKSLQPLLRSVAEEIQQLRDAWLARWETEAVQLASAIARRILRRELNQQPELPVALVAEALQLVAGKPDIRIVLNPDDHRDFGLRIVELAREAAGLSEANLASDSAITRGGCRVETRYGVIDQTLEAQLDRIEDELT